jgi:hypothetical protein
VTAHFKPLGSKYKDINIKAVSHTLKPQPQHKLGVCCCSTSGQVTYRKKLGAELCQAQVKLDYNKIVISHKGQYLFEAMFTLKLEVFFH